MPQSQTHNNICNAGLQLSCVIDLAAAKDSFSLDAPAVVVLGKNPCLSTQPESNRFALLGSNENQDAREGGTLAQVVRNRGLRLYSFVTLEMTNGTPEHVAFEEYFNAHSCDSGQFNIVRGELVTSYKAELLTWAETFDRIFAYFATFGDEWNEYEEGIDIACGMFENKIGIYGLYENVRFAAV